MPVRQSLTLCVSLFLLLSPLGAKTLPAPGLEPSYVSALAAADHFLQAWQSGDVENGMVLMSGHAKEKATTEIGREIFFQPEPLGL
jgi:hypothetical protein